jgi:hypothetical protein
MTPHELKQARERAGLKGPRLDFDGPLPPTAFEDPVDLERFPTPIPSGTTAGCGCTRDPATKRLMAHSHRPRSVASVGSFPSQPALRGGLAAWCATCALAACGGSSLAANDSSFTDASADMAMADAGAYGEVMSESGALRFEVRTGPTQPPTRGVSTVWLAVSDAASGEPTTGLELTVVPWMPAMGHGTSVKPAIEAAGDGQFVVSRVNLYMGGKWDLRIAISGAVTDRATIHFAIR